MLKSISQLNFTLFVVKSQQLNFTVGTTNWIELFHVFINWTIPHKLNERGIKWTIYILWLNTKKETGRLARASYFCRGVPVRARNVLFAIRRFCLQNALARAQVDLLGAPLLFYLPSNFTRGVAPDPRTRAFEWQIKFHISYKTNKERINPLLICLWVI